MNRSRHDAVLSKDASGGGRCVAHDQSQVEPARLGRPQTAVNASESIAIRKLHVLVECGVRSGDGIGNRVADSIIDSGKRVHVFPRRSWRPYSPGKCVFSTIFGKVAKIAKFFGISRTGTVSNRFLAHAAPSD